ncbi:MAG: hypothetical protein WBH04_09230, partial [Albidovulum sp.]
RTSANHSRSAGISPAKLNYQNQGFENGLVLACVCDVAALPHRLVVERNTMHSGNICRMDR